MTVNPTDPEYRRKVYQALKGELGDSFNKSEEEFYAALDNEEGYVDKVYGALKGELGDSFDKDPETFRGLVIAPDVEKKSPVQTESSDYTSPDQKLDYITAPESESISSDTSRVVEADPKRQPIPAELKAKDPSFWESVSNTASNVATQLEGVLPRLNLAAADVWEKVLGKEMAEDFYEWDPLKEQTLEGSRQRAYKDISRLDNEMQPTRGFVESWEDRDAAGLGAATIESVGSLISTAVPAFLSGGSTLVSDQVGRSISDYNTTKAKDLGISVEELYETGEAEFNTPATLGVISAALEGFGLKGIGSAITKKVSKPLQEAVTIALASNKEGATEFAQTGVETFNKALAEGLSNEEALGKAAERMFSKEGLESYIQGAAGGGVATGTGRKVNQKLAEHSINKTIDNSETYQKPSDLFKEENVSEIDDTQVTIAGKTHSRNVIEKDLKKQVKEGIMTEAEATRNLQLFDETKALVDATREAGLSEGQQVKAVNLLREKIRLEEKIKGKDKDLFKPEKERIKEIGEQITNLRNTEPAKRPTAEDVLNSEDVKIEDGFANSVHDRIKSDLKSYEKGMQDTEDKSYAKYSKKKKELLEKDPIRYYQDKIKIAKEEAREDGDESGYHASVINESQQIIDYLKQLNETKQRPTGETGTESTTPSGEGTSETGPDQGNPGDVRESGGQEGDTQDQEVTPTYEDIRYEVEEEVEKDYKLVGDDTYSLKFKREVNKKTDQRAREAGVKIQEPVLSPDFVEGGNTSLVSTEEIMKYSGEDRSGNRKRIDELKEDIQKNGLKEPVILRYDNGEASVIEGNHRLIALQELGYKYIPVDVRKDPISDKGREIPLKKEFTPLTPEKTGSVNAEELGLTSLKINESDYVQQSDTFTNREQSSEVNTDVQDTNTPNTKLTKDKTKEIADKLRSLKINKTVGDATNTLQSNPVGGLFAVAWDGAIEVAATTIEATGNVAQAMQDAYKAFEQSDYFKNLTAQERVARKDEFENKITEAFDETIPKNEKLANKLRTYKTNNLAKTKIEDLNPEVNKQVFEDAWDMSMSDAEEVASYTGDIAQATDAALTTLKNSEWFETLSPNGKGKALRMLREDMARKFGEAEVNNPSYWESLKASANKLGEVAFQRFADKYYFVRKGVKKNFKNYRSNPLNFSRAEILMHGKAVADLEKFNTQMEGTLKKATKAGFTVDQLSEWLYAKHAKERNKHIREHVDPENQFGSGMTDAEADKILEGKYTDEQVKKLNELQAEVKALLDSTREIMLEHGLITQEQYNTFSDYYEDYVPLQSFEANHGEDKRNFIDKIFNLKPEKPIEEVNMLVGTSFSIDTKVSQRAVGRSTRAGNVLANIVKQRINTVMWARKNEVLQKMYNLYNEQPDNGMFEMFHESELPTKHKIDKNGKSITVREEPRNKSEYVGVKVDGEQYYFKFHNKEVGRVLNSANMEKTDLITRTLGRLNRFLSMTMTTLNPEFAATNFARDIQTAVYHLKSEHDTNESLKDIDLTDGILGNTTRAIKAIYRNEVKKESDSELGQYYEEFKAEGAKTGWVHQFSLEDIAKDLNRLQEEAEAENMSKANLKKQVRGVIDYIENVNTAVENGVRLAAYVKMRENGVSKAEAAEIAKELTVNFNKSGEWGPLFNSLYLFFNAAVQGNVRLIKAMTKFKETTRPDGTVKKSLNGGQKLAAATVITGSLITLLNQAISEDDEDEESFYNKIPDYEKERNLIIMNPMNGKDYFKFPLPYGYNVFHNLGMILTEGLSGDRTIGNSAAFLASSTISSFVPISFGGSDDPVKNLVSGASPTVTKPFVELAINESFFGSSIYNENMPYAVPRPESMMGRETTPEVFREITEFLNEASGGNEYEPGDIDFAPESLYHITKFFTGGIGRSTMYAAETVDSGIDYVTDVVNNVPPELRTEVETRKIPFVRKVYGEPNEYVDQDIFYERLDKVQQRSAYLKDQWTNKKLTPEEKKSIPFIRELEANYKDAADDLSEIRKRKDKAVNIENPLKRAERVKQLEDMYYKRIKNANKLYNELVKKGKIRE